MKKNLLYFAALICAIMAFGCSKEMDHSAQEPVNPGEEEVTPGPAAKQIIITANLVDTKVTFDPAFYSDHSPMAMGHLWEEGDKLRVTAVGNDSNTGIFDLIDGEGTATAHFRGEIAEAEAYNIEVIPVGSPSEGDEQTQNGDGATDHLKFVACASNVEDLSSFDLEETSGIIGFIAKLPENVTETIESLVIEKSTDDFATKSTLTVNLGEAHPDLNGDGILEVYANIPAGWEVADGTKMFLKFNSSNGGHTVYTRYLEFEYAKTLYPGEFNYIKVNASESDKHAGPAGADGSENNPYLIADKYQMDAMHELMVSGTTYFKLVDDIDMTGVSWTVLNNSGSYDKVINFDGNNKTIRNIAGTMFYVFKGTAKDVTLDNPTITAGNKKGAFSQFIQGINNYITNVDVSNVSEFAGSNGPCGGLVGLVNSGAEGETTATFDGCDVSNVIVNSAGSNGMAGGLIGSVEAKVVIKNCTYSGNTVHNSYEFVGGLIGKATAEVSITGSSVSSATVSGRDAVGGMIGHCEAGGSLTSCSVAADVSGRNYIGGVVGRESTASGKTFDISKCSFEKGSAGVSATAQYVGGILGNQYGKGTVTIENCYVNSPVSAAGSWAGGISSNHYNGTLTISKCYVMGSVSALYGAGGIVGQVRATNLTINPCAVYVSSITATDSSGTEYESSGTIVAYGKGVNVTIARNCWYDQTLTFTDCTGNDGNPSSWPPAKQGGLSNAAISGGTPHDKIYPYWGRYTDPSSYPLNKMCKEILEFSADDWDLDVNPPILKN